MLISSIISVVVIIANLALGMVILTNNSRKKANRVIFGIAVSSAFWVFANFMVDIAKNDTTALIWSRATLLGVIFIPAFFIYFSYVFLQEKKIGWKIFFLIFSLPFIFLPFLPTRYNIQEAQIISGEVPKVVPGTLYLYFFVYFIAYCLIAIFRFLKGIKGRPRVEKAQINYIIWGSIISLSLGIFANLILLLMGVPKASSFGPFATIVWVSALSIAILRYHLFNIKIVLAEVLVFIIGIILFIQVFTVDTFSMKIFNGSVFILFCFFGYLLIRSVLREIELQEQLAAANKELKRLDEAKTEFLSIASHQLRTPLTAIKGYVAMIQEGIYGDISDKVKVTLDKVNDSSERLIRLVNSLLDISRLEMGRMEFDFKETQVEDLIQSIVDELYVRASKKKLKLIYKEPEKDLSKITIDPQKIRLVILNLIDNAIKYTDHGNVEVKVEEKNGAQKRILITVSDTGMGISKKDMGQLFKIYRRGTGVRLFPEGSGVGLYVAKKLVEAHKGKVWAKSEGRGKGSIFYVELPINGAKIQKFLKDF